jgi:type 2 lantibiotic biosynthesis protein LanM
MKKNSDFIKTTIDEILEKATHSCELEKPHIDNWIGTLQDIIQALHSPSFLLYTGDKMEDFGYRDPDHPIPFEEILSPFIKIASQKLLDRIGDNYSLLSKDSHASLQRSLLRRLSHIFSRSLFLEFSIFRALKNSCSTHYFHDNQTISGKIVYNNFVQKMLPIGLTEFLKEYAVLARLAAIAIDFWVDSMNEFVSRLAADKSEIRSHFCHQQDPGVVIEVFPAISDFHHDGRTVISIVFTSGLKLVYKPRNLGIEESFFSLLNWINKKSSSLSFRVLQILNKSTHGWMEFIDAHFCEKKQSVKAFYRKAGGLLCVLHVLRGSDFHGENIIAAGENPVIFDLEVLFRNTRRESSTPNSLSEKVFCQLNNSVLAVGLLPHWEYGVNGQCFDLSGLGCTTGQETCFKSWSISNINTDSMSGQLNYIETFSEKNLPAKENISLLLNRHKEDIIEGFQEIYHLLVSYRNNLSIPSSPLRSMACQRTRFLLRSTGEYFSLANKLLEPKFLRNDADWSLLLNSLRQNSLLKDNHVESFVESEIRSMRKMDIPIFSSSPDSLDVINESGEVVKDFFDRTSFDLVDENLRSLNQENLEQQIYFIRGAISARILDEIKPDVLSDKFTAEATIPSLNNLTKKELLEKASDIAEDLQKTSILENGSATWITYGLHNQSRALQFHSMSYSLYDGCCGVALFLSALEKITNSSRFAELRLAALHPLTSQLHSFDGSSGLLKKIGIGGLVGLGSVVYSLTRISQFTGEAALLLDARCAAELITFDSIANDNILDVTGGVAGTILGLLALHEISGEPSLLQKAIACGEHLISKQILDPSGYPIWKTIGEQPLTGFAHGAAGIFYALLRLHVATNNHFFSSAALEALNFERRAFSDEAGNWPDYRLLNIDKKKQCSMNSWCHGATGIGLSRLAALSIMDDSAVRDEIDVALKATSLRSLRGLDAPCCGNSGIVDLFLLAGDKLHRPDYYDIAQQLITSTISKAKKTECFQYFPKLLGDVYIPGFFQGTAGIGYQILRAAYPDKLPSVLLLE